MAEKGSVASKPDIVLVGMLALLTYTAFHGVLRNNFVNYDDEGYVTANALVRSGINLQSVILSFTQPHYFMWHPLTTLSHMLDCQLFGLNPFWHHLNNLLLHICGVILLLFILNAMTHQLWPSAFAAVLFAVHPLNVESVAWVAERKNVLYGFFWFLTIAAYVRYSARPGTLRYLAVVLAAGLSMLSKPAAVVLPFALLLLDYWPLQRLQPKNRQKEITGSDTPRYGQASFPQLVKEKIPLFAMAVVLGILTVTIQHGSGVVKGSEFRSFHIRLANALVSYVMYIVKTVYPHNLAVFYPYPGNSLAVWKPVAAFAAIAAVSIAVFFARQKRYLVFGWLWYLTALSPNIGLIQSGDQAMADRYAYISVLGLFIAVTWWIADLLREWKYSGKLLTGAGVFVITVLWILTRTQVGYWQNSISLFEHAVKATRSNYVAHNNLASAFLKAGRFDDAIIQCDEALRYKQDFVEVYLNLGSAYRQKGWYERAIETYKKAMEISPQSVEIYYKLGDTYGRIGRYDKAIEAYKKAIELYPDYAQVYNGLGVIYGQTGRYDESISAFKRAIEIVPYFAEAHCGLGISYAMTGNTSGAVAEYEMLKTLDVNLANKLLEVMNSLKK